MANPADLPGEDDDDMEEDEFQEAHSVRVEFHRGLGFRAPRTLGYAEIGIENPEFWVFARR